MPQKERIKYKSSFETSREIIKILALEKEYAQYDIPGQIGKNYRTILRHLSYLKKNGLIRLSRTEKAKKGGIDKNIFTLTEAGLLCSLGYRDLWSDIDKVANNYDEVLPLIFGKWSFYVKKGLRNEIIARLKAAVTGMCLEFGRDWYRIVRGDVDKSTKIRLEKLKGKEIAEEVMASYRTIAPTLTHRVLGLAPYLYFGPNSKDTDEQAKFIRILLDDKDLEQYCDREFDYWVKQAKSEYKRYLEALKWYQQIKSRTRL